MLNFLNGYNIIDDYINFEFFHEESVVSNKNIFFIRDFSLRY